MTTLNKTKPRKYVRKYAGLETLELGPVNTTDFTLPIEDHIARYDVELLANYWNDHYTPQKLSTKICKSVVFGLPGRIAKSISLFVVAFYTFNYFRIEYGCVPSKSFPINTLPDHLKEGSPRNSNATCYGPDVFDVVREENNNFFSVLMFLTGVYVTTNATRFWSQVTALPRMEEIANIIATKIWSDPSKRETEIELVEGMNVKQFKMRLARWMLLSWAMLLSQVSTNLNEKLPSPKEFNDKRLLTRNEYNALKGKCSETDADGTDEDWLCRWTSPILWACKLIQRATKYPKNPDLAMVREEYWLTAKILAYQSNLKSILDHHTFKFPRILFQAMKCALYTFLFLGVFGGHSDVYGTHDKVPLTVKLLWITPSCIYQIMKFTFIFGWCLAAKDLRNPFGDDE